VTGSREGGRELRAEDSDEGERGFGERAWHNREDEMRREQHGE